MQFLINNLNMLGIHARVEQSPVGRDVVKFGIKQRLVKFLKFGNLEFYPVRVLHRDADGDLHMTELTPFLII